jgi:hypothetical protein
MIEETNSHNYMGKIQNNAISLSVKDALFDKILRKRHEYKLYKK